MIKKPGNTKADQVTAMVEAVRATGEKIVEVIIEPKCIRIRTLAESPPSADPVERWFEGRNARKADRRA